MAISFKRTYASVVVFHAPDPVAGSCQPMHPPETPGHSQESLAQSLVGTLLLSLGSWCAQSFVLCLYKQTCIPNLFPQSCGSSVIKSHWPPKRISWESSVPLPDPPVGKSVVGPRTFITVQELLWYNCSPVCGSSTL